MGAAGRCKARLLAQVDDAPAGRSRRHPVQGRHPPGTAGTCGDRHGAGECDRDTAPGAGTEARGHGAGDGQGDTGLGTGLSREHGKIRVEWRQSGKS